MRHLSVVRKHDFGGYKGNNYTDDLLYSSKHKGFIAAMNSKVYWIYPDDITIREEIDEGTKVTIADFSIASFSLSASMTYSLSTTCSIITAYFFIIISLLFRMEIYSCVF